MDTYTYGSTQPRAVTAAGSNSYSYEANGNLVSRSIGSGSYTFTYDAESRLVGVSGAARASYVYDGDGKLVRGTVNGTTWVYVGKH